MANGCGGCPYHSYPYKARIPILVDGVRETKTFTCKEDVWEVIELLIDEAESQKQGGQSVDVAQSISSQIPFFACKNVLSSKEYQNDVARYVYCKEFGVSPYPGDYSKHPFRWVEKSFIIKTAFAKMENAQLEKAKKDGSRK